MEQKTAIVIGASTGIGAATAEALAQQYKKIAITSFRHPEKLKEVQQKILAQGTDCYAEIGDAGDFTFVRQFIERRAGRDEVLSRRKHRKERGC